jgi:hypothetical protein
VIRSLTPEELRRKVRGSKAKAAGDTLEDLALRYLAARGVLAQRIATPCVVVGGRKRFTHKVCGDLVGVGIGGQCVLVECKHRTTEGEIRRPRPSDFQPHQHTAHREWAAKGAMVLVAYLDPQGGLIVEPADRFTPKGNA